MPSDLLAIARRNPPQRWTKPIVRRPDADLPFDPLKIGRGELVMPDATVYIDQLKGKLPTAVEKAIAGARVLHSATALGEIAITIGFLDPNDARTPANRAVLEGLLGTIQEERVVTPSASGCIEAALIAGAFARLTGLPKESRRKALNDVLILLAARSAGATLISRNIDDMDRLNQMRPDTRILLYRV